MSNYSFSHDVYRNHYVCCLILMLMAKTSILHRILTKMPFLNWINCSKINKMRLSLLRLILIFCYYFSILHLISMGKKSSINQFSRLIFLILQNKTHFH